MPNTLEQLTPRFINLANELSFGMDEMEDAEPGDFITNDNLPWFRVPESEVSGELGVQSAEESLRNLVSTIKDNMKGPTVVAMAVNWRYNFLEPEVGFFSIRLFARKNFLAEACDEA